MKKLMKKVEGLEEMSEVYALLCGRCLECDGDKEELKRVVVRFESEEQLNWEADNFFDEVYDSFNAGLPKGWFVDEAPEIERLITREEAEAAGFVVFQRQ